MSKHITYPKAQNPVRAGLKKFGSPRAYFAALKEHVAAVGGLTAIEWDWYRARQREWEPEILAAEMKAADRRIAIDHARKLSIADLKAIIAEKTSAATCGS